MMNDKRRTEKVSRDSSSTEDSDELIEEEEEARRLFDSDHVIPSHQIPYVLQWLRQSFSLIELEVLKVSLEKNDVACDVSYIPNKLHNSRCNEKGQRYKCYLKLLK
ncbi:uncharacterized protein Gasu_12270 [Galdieria sulphuraria]|uniref:Uncharacterized protein n=1 Tax=Galdieria sulphuraria TaxID=130081 RepID=M2X4Z9_GALSU|nr:uncharacterized protein Gasu_12270 [Galdieria sulphuraria]EME31555.1 hypothetical protein Gasu_12270 [Galdieria sulphuraria]|eukprot:XP_005708075.1 hypothetical protein Gasu_12270 [Galdieria sulphuraria]